jgi:hypothetical protein
LSGGDLTSGVIPSSVVPVSPGWVEVDVPDVSVTPGSMYFVVVRFDGGGSGDCVLWRFGYDVGYDDGLFWFSSSGGGSWSSYGFYDFCFETYGLS